MTKINVEFALETETKGAFRFQETKGGKTLKIADGAKIGTLYVRKDALDGDAPKKLKVEIAY